MHLLKLLACVREVRVIDVELQGAALLVDLLVFLEVRAILVKLRQLLPQLLDLNVVDNSSFC